ncbi:MAG TPA: LLM class F420-dependent oxidoreductase [Solirubrobacterales bacterium]|nr:LLM class F420-dependent oxidoreductase [Solirubrobacterales bacterium]
MPTRVGVQIQPQQADFAQMREAWRTAEELGVDSIYTWDHFYPLYGDADGKHFEGATSLAALAASTERVKIGALVFCNSYRNPQLLANIHSTIDHLSGGRVILGIGAGWFERDYDEYGYEFGTAPERLKALGRDLPLIEQRLAKLNPPPVGEIPIMIGGAGEKVTLRLVAQHAKLWHTFADPETYLHKSQVLAEHCERLGRDPATIERVIGSQASILEHADALAEAGVDELTVGVGGGPDGYDLGEVRELLQWRDARNARG